ncbi:MAG: hypothetical protein AAF226_07405 [Verrucomicrobiota bacterium]
MSVLAWAAIGAAIISMIRIADMDNKRPWLWGLVTAFWCGVGVFFLNGLFVGAFGFIAGFLSMWLSNLFID